MKHFTKAQWITPEPFIEPDVRKGAGYLKKRFEYKEGRATLYATAHGLYQISINGQEITKARLTPGCDDYDIRLQYQEYDVTSFLKQGDNEIFVILGDGWYRGCNGIDGIRNLYGKDMSFICSMFTDKDDSDPILVTDESWLASQDGGILLTDLELGETCDMGKEITDWHEATSLRFDNSNLVEQKSPYVTEHEVFEGKLLVTPAGENVFDFGQNLAGYTHIKIKDAKCGDKVKLIHGETLDENGNFTIANFQPGDRNKSGGIKQEINLICKEGTNEFKPHFSMFGFRYAKLVTDIPVENIEVSSIAVYSDMKQTSFFECSNKDVNKLFQNSIWSMKSNFCDIPTDCPTRERAGWTGDAAVFVKTGLYLMDCGKVFKKWLANVRALQHEDGKMAYICPKNSNPGKISEMFSASVGWGDSAVIVPWNLYCMSGDKEILSSNYNMMKKWVDFLKQRAGKSKLKNRFGKNPYRKYIIDTGMDYGEWCEPGADVMKTMTEAFKNGQPEVATAYFAYSSRILSKVADILGHDEDSRHYAEISVNATNAYRHLTLKDGHITSMRQCEYVRPLAFGLLEEKDAIIAAKDLNELVIKNGYHLNTGFLSTPFLCKVLADYGYIDTAYRLLLQKEYPSWLYSVEKGATTIWETWDGIRKDNTVHDSLNHYSYGAISGWLISGICGINYAHDKLVIKPVPNKQLEYAKARFESPEGTIISEWKYNKDIVSIHMEIPKGVEADIITPDGKHHLIDDEIFDYECSSN
ncbi:MAG: glycoside hydrolase family 78 protein [Butyrivibrio sp.]|uniref:family 78 glycoside hydrolase catalytic domain n=1 Tax=Butyrivibrio sp. TaxID=28121 RepID=UPI0025D441C0|nr:family 78 glycoside hydrolase catalytic domain [Butyrivibrio sp.]MCR5772380.1 glycoside hydrolase family 78 protein [Butyrivibrio sp.]